MKQRILKICREHCGYDISENTELLRSKRMESFQLMEIIVELEDKFGVELEPIEIGNLQNFETVNAIWEMIEKHLQNYS